MRPLQWRAGNHFTLLENGEAYYPDLFAAIDAAEKEVLLETFILFDDPVGRELGVRLAAAARRGCRVALTVDGYGSYELSDEFVAHLTTAGVDLHVFDPQPTTLGVRTNLFRRLHRKLVVIDRQTGYISGINFSQDHLWASGTESKQDYALKVTGPVVSDIRELMEEFLRTRGIPERQPLLSRWRQRWAGVRSIVPAATREGGRAALVVRDNGAHRQDIEMVYRTAVRAARSEIIIANAYFLPGHHFLQELHDAARRGVKVRLIVQGVGDWPLMQAATKGLYDYLMGAGVVLHEYCRRPMHGKVAVIDDDWCTIGSSNLDPLSLFLNLEANLVVRDPDLARRLRAGLMRLIEVDCVTVNIAGTKYRSFWRRSLSVLLFHLLRRFPYWSGWLPGHANRIHRAKTEAPASA